MIIALVPILATCIGLLIYVIASNAKLVECGRALFWCGLLVTIFALANHTVRIG